MKKQQEQQQANMLQMQGDPNLQQADGIQPNNIDPIPQNAGSLPCTTPIASWTPNQQQKPSKMDLSKLSYPRDSFNFRNY